jgi:hypothetical protein
MQISPKFLKEIPAGQPRLQGHALKDMPSLKSSASQESSPMPAAA